MRNIDFFGSTGPSARSNFCIRAVTSATSCSNSSRSTSYAGLFHANHGRLLFCSSPLRNSKSTLRCMPRLGKSCCPTARVNGPQFGLRPARLGLVALSCPEPPSAADIAHLDLGQRRGPFRADLGIAVGAPGPDRGKCVDDLLVRAAVPQQRAKIVALSREQAGIELAVG